MTTTSEKPAPQVSSAAGATETVPPQEAGERLASASERLRLANAELQDQLARLLGEEQGWERERALFRAMIDQMPDYVFFKDTASRFVIANRSVAADLGLEPDDLIGKTDLELHPSPERARKFLHDEATVIRTGQPLLDVPEYIIRPDGSEKHLMTTKVPLRDEAGAIIGVVGISRDVTERKKAEDEVRFLAHHDALTRLPNRAVFMDRLEQAILKARRDRRWAAVAFLDLDKFKAVNDSLGHDAGDELLRIAARRMGGCVRDTDTLARIGGDEFMILFADQPGSPHALTATLERLRQAIAEPITLNGHTVRVTCSIGMATFPNDGDDAESLLKNADAAMYQAKLAGRDSFRFYTQAMNAEAKNHVSLLFALRNAISGNELSLHYQPQIDLQTGRVTAVEALLRWQHPTLGAIPPATFIPIAEESGLIASIGDWVLRTACTQNKAWQDAGLPFVRMTVNVSAIQFEDRSFVDRVKSILAETRLDPTCLELELTESLLMRDVTEAIRTMNELQAIGVSFAIDDFGMGYSSLSTLKKFPVARLKIDQSFIHDLTSDEDDRHITTAVIALGHKLNMRVIAEGVETDEQLAFLSENACNEVQGFRFSRPVPADELTALLRNQKPAPEAGS